MTHRVFLLFCFVNLAILVGQATEYAQMHTPLSLEQIGELDTEEDNDFDSELYTVTSGLLVLSSPSTATVQGKIQAHYHNPYPSLSYPPPQTFHTL